jgi:hypothetical protein
MGEKRGVVGVAESAVGCIEMVAGGAEASDSFSGGKSFQDDVTSNDFSTARRYFPIVL